MNKERAFYWTHRLLSAIYNDNEEEAKRFYEWVGDKLNIKDEVKQ